MLFRFCLETAAENIAAFYHAAVTADGSHYRILQKQISDLNSTGILARVNTIYYGVIHPLDKVSAKKKFKIHADKFVSIGYWYSGQEMKTLSYLYKFCKSNPTYKVLYFHMKGSNNPLPRNQQARDVLGAFTFNPACIDALDKYDTCGWRLSPVPYIHYSGNFWWARCTYINTLMDPSLMVMGSDSQKYMGEEMMKHFPADTRTFAIPKKDRMEICVGLSRYFGEAWLGSGTYINGADCLPEDSDPNFIMYGEYVPAFLQLADDYLTRKRKMVIFKFKFAYAMYLTTIFLKFTFFY